MNFLQNMKTPTNILNSPDNPITTYDTSSGKPIDITDQYTTDISNYAKKYELNPTTAMTRPDVPLTSEQATFLENSTLVKEYLGSLLRGEEVGSLEILNPNARYGEQPNVDATQSASTSRWFDINRNITQEQRDTARAEVQQQMDSIGYTGNLLKDFDPRSPTSIPVTMTSSGLKKLDNLFGTEEENNNQINMQSGDSESTDTDSVISINTEPKSDPKPKIKKEEGSTVTDTATDTATSDDEVVATGSVENPFASGDLNYQYEVTKSDLRILENSGILNNRGLTNKQVFDFVGNLKSSGVGVLEYVSFSNQMRTDPSRKKEFDSLTTGAEQGAYIRYQNALEDMQSRNRGQRFGVRTDKKGNVSLTKEGQKRVFLQQLGKDIFVEGKFSMSEINPDRMFEDKGDGRINFSLEEYSALINKRASMLERLKTNYEAQNNELAARQAQQQQENLIVGQKLQGHYATLTGTRIARDGTSFTPIEKIQQIIQLQERLEETQDLKVRKKIEKEIGGLKSNFGIKDLDIRAFDYVREYDKKIAKTAGSL